MKASIKSIAAIGSMIALVLASGCATTDTLVSADDNGYTASEGTNGQDILKLMHVDSQSGGE